MKKGRSQECRKIPIYFSMLHSKLLRMSRNGPFHFERILGKVLLTLDTDDTDNGLQNSKINTIQ